MSSRKTANRKPSASAKALHQLSQTMTSTPGPTIPLPDLTAVSNSEANRTARLVLGLSAILGPSFPHPPVELGGTTAAPAGTSVGVNAILERTILAQRQTNEWLEKLSNAMAEYLGTEGQA